MDEFKKKCCFFKAGQLGPKKKKTSKVTSTLKERHRGKWFQFPLPKALGGGIGGVPLDSHDWWVEELSTTFLVGTLR